MHVLDTVLDVCWCCVLKNIWIDVSDMLRLCIDGQVLFGDVCDMHGLLI